MSDTKLYTKNDLACDKQDILADYADGSIDLQTKEERLFKIRIARKKSIEAFGE